MYVADIKWLAIVLGVFFFSSNSVYAYTITINGGQSHYRLETDQTGVSSEYLFDPAYTGSIDATFQLAKFHDLELYFDYARYSIDTINVPLPLNESSFDYFKGGFNYYGWFYSGFGMVIGGGTETIPSFRIDTGSVSVVFDTDQPFTGNLGLAWRAKNQISTLELGYLYKNIFFSDSGATNRTGFSNQIYMIVDFGRRQPVKMSSEVYYQDHQYEGYFGLKFKYENTQIKNTFETTIDDRLVEVYFRMRFKSDVF